MSAKLGKDSVSYDVLNSVGADSEIVDCVWKQISETNCNGDEFIDWAKGYDSVKVIQMDLPYGILPQSVMGTLADVKVDCRGPDDKVYDSNALIRRKVARGNTFLKIDNEPWRCVIYATKKFTGGMGDDDDRGNGGDRTIWKNYFSKNVDEAKKVIAIRKANGEAAHLSCVKLSGVVYFCIGSKNVHLLIKNNNDIEKYSAARYSVAKEIAHCVMEFLAELDDSKRSRLIEFLCETKYTAVMEILNPTHQHVEDLSYLGDKCQLQFITWTSPDMSESDTGLCAMPPDMALNIASHLGFQALKHDIISPVEAEARMHKLRKEYGFEGEVFYYVGEDGQVFGMLKKKTAWYIILRAIREKVRNALNPKRSESKGVTHEKITKRIREIQTWLGLDKKSTSSWQSLGIAFYSWITTKRKSIEDIANLFPVTWNEFLKDTGNSDDIKYECGDLD